jgi:hypothetical protein
VNDYFCCIVTHFEIHHDSSCNGIEKLQVIFIYDTVFKYLRDNYKRSDTAAKFSSIQYLYSLRLKDGKDVQRFMGEFISTRERLAGMKIEISDELAIYQILMSLPEAPIWSSFCQIVTTSMNKGMSFAEFRTMLISECERMSLMNEKMLLVSEYANYSKSKTIRTHAKNPNGVTCTVCGKASHDKDHCWEKGGGLEGQKPDWMIRREASKSNAKSNDAISKAASSCERANIS